MAPALVHDGNWMIGTVGSSHDRRQLGAPAQAATPPTYLAIGVGVGAVILIALVALVVKLVRKRRRHHREVEALQVEEGVHDAQRQEIVDVPRPVASVRHTTFSPLGSRGGWGALASDETIHEPRAGSKRKKGKRVSVSLPKRFKHGGIPLRRLKRLTAIIESPRSRSAALSPALPAQESNLETRPSIQSETDVNSKAYTLRMVSDEDVFLCPGSPKPDVLPSFAIRSPGRYGSGIALSNTQKAARSQSVGALMVPPTHFANSYPPQPPQMHSRSISLGASTSRPPSGPVPPLPTASAEAKKVQQPSRQGLCVSRMSSSSGESTRSSVLVMSPILKMKDKNQSLGSPTVEEVVADDDTASLKTVSQRKWSSPTLGAHARPDGVPPAPNTVPLTAHHSLRSNIARYSIHSQGSRLSHTSARSTDDGHNRLSIPQIATADRVSISRVPSASSLSSMTGVRKITTPRRASRSSVSANGSPAERKKTSVLRDISGNSILPPTRKASTATDDSSRSSHGNPFQWDNQPLPKPSALKGSPNARKGHRRQNCVRISTLTPQILGPPPSRPTSPSIMHGIEEEGEDSDVSTRLRFVTNQRPSRPPSTSLSAPNLGIQTLRASITPGSPTLSAWNAFQAHSLPSEHSDSNLSASPDKRSHSRHSTVSSFSIPYFPSPVKPSLSNVQLPHPIPEFCLSRPSTDIEHENTSSPFAIYSSSDSIEIPSSPPLPALGLREYDPAHQPWPLVDLPPPQTQEHDPESPPMRDVLEPERSPPYFPFAQNQLDVDEEVSPHSRPVSTAHILTVEDSPPCSPKTMPEGFKTFFDTYDLPPRAAEKLTSQNASAVMARMPIPSRTVDFPGAPILAPPSNDMDAFTCAETPAPPPKSILRRSRAVSSAVNFQPVRPAPASPIPNNDSCIVSPLHINNKSTPTQRESLSPQGPRSQPAQSVLKNAMALRRMNSEIHYSPSLTHLDRESTRYLRLGREASPLLPWIGSPDLASGMDAIFDFDLAASSDTGGGAEENGVGIGDGIMDDTNLAEIERKLDGALAGFDALPASDASHDTITSLGVVEQYVSGIDGCRRLSVWDDGEKYWEQDNYGSGGKESIEADILDVTPVKVWMGIEQEGVGRRESNEYGWASIQCTPKSLYDSDGFLRT